MQEAFDIDALITEATPAPIYTGRAPLGFTTEMFTLDEFAAAEKFLRSIGQGFGIAVGPPHIWRAGLWSPSTPGHELTFLTADLGCAHHQHGGCHCVGERVFRAVCGCGWVSNILGAEATAVEQWHDHAWPGWRDLPVVPDGLTDKKRDAWVRDQYDGELRSSPGAPLLTTRSYPFTRHAPGRSPWGGYDLCGLIVKGTR